MEFLVVYLIFCLIIAAGLGVIPAYIARDKGYSFGRWWFYGWMLFIVAMIHISLLPDKNARPASPPSPPPRKPPAWGAADEIRKYKELLDSGILTQEEFDRKKAQLLDL